MPQLQPVDFAPQLIWLAITFAFLYLALSYLVIPRIQHTLTRRAAKLTDDMTKARAAREKADLQAARYEAELKEARVKAQSMLRLAREKLEAENHEKRAKIDQELHAKQIEARSRVEDVLGQARAQMQTMTADVVGDIVKKLAGLDVSQDEVRQTLSERSKG